MMQGCSTDHVNTIRESLGRLPDPVPHPALVLVTGLPGTGKSCFCRRLLENVEAVLLESDALRRRLFPAPLHDPEESGQLFRAIHCIIGELLERGRNVILDATNLEEHRREMLYHIADQANAGLIVVKMRAPEAVVKERLDRRQSRPDPEDHSEANWNVYARMRPTADRISRNHFVVDSSQDTGPAVDKIVRLINR